MDSGNAIEYDLTLALMHRVDYIENGSTAEVSHIELVEFFEESMRHLVGLLYSFDPSGRNCRAGETTDNHLFIISSVCEYLGRLTSRILARRVRFAKRT
jgi:hypothetical protein